MAKFKLSVEGDTFEELKSAWAELLEELGAGSGGGDESDGGGDGGDGDGGDEGGGDESLLEDDASDEHAELREKLKAIIVKYSKKPADVEKVKKAFTALKVKRFGEVADDDLKKLETAFKKLGLK